MDMHPVGAVVLWKFPNATGNIYFAEITEQHPPKKKGDVMRYRIKSAENEVANFNCYAFHDDMK